MTFTLWRKLLRDVRVPLLVVSLLLFAFELLWVKVTERVTTEIAPMLELLSVMNVGAVVALVALEPAVEPGEVVERRGDRVVIESDPSGEADRLGVGWPGDAAQGAGVANLTGVAVHAMAVHLAELGIDL